MRKVWKFSVEMSAVATTLQVPHGAKILAFGMQGRTPVFWAEVDDAAPKIARTFLIVGTGHPVPDRAEWRGTVQDEPSVVWHVYESV